MCTMNFLTLDSQVINQYRHLVSMAQDFPTVPWTIVSATMTDTSLARLLKELQINTIVPHLPVNRDRPNIYYEVIYNEQDTLPLIARMLEEGCVYSNPQLSAELLKPYNSRSNLSTIIFCAFISRCLNVKRELQKRGLTSVTYYGGLEPKTSAQCEELQSWLDGKCNVMIATVSQKDGFEVSDLQTGSSLRWGMA
jgi:superfamily II DNA helicase RecQ